MVSDCDPGPPATDCPSQRDVILAQLGDRAALERLLAHTRPWLHRCLRAMLGDAEGEDATQNVMFTIARRLVTLDEPRAYRAWVYRVATRHAVRLLSKRRKHHVLEEAVEGLVNAASSADPVLDEEERRRLQQEISALSPNSLAVVVLHYFEGLSIARVAAVLGVPEGTVKSRIHTALRALRRAWPGGPG